jgi:AraC family transcriptional regulator
MNWRNYADYYRRSGYGAFPQEHRQSIGRLPFHMIHVEQGPHNFSDPAVSETVLALPLAVPTECNWRWTIDGRSYRDTARPGGMLVVPAEVESHWEVDGKRRLLILSMPHETVQGVLGTASPSRIRDAFWALGERAWGDPFVEPLLMRLWEAAALRDPLAGRMADGIVTTILSHLLLRAGGGTGTGPTVALPRWRLKRVQDYVDAHIDQPIGLDEMSEAASLSRRHFARSFAAELGVTPHKWLMRRRLDRAQDLLVSTDQPVCDIAQVCGFSSQSHLTSLMRQETGTTPYRWRQRNRLDS